jgi:hypothetical protein
MAHSKLIKDLGDTGVVAAALGQQDSAVSMWKRRGVPWRWRPALAQMAEAGGVDLPDGFLDPAQERAA